MSEPPAQPFRFVGVTGNQIGAEFRALDIGDIVTIDHTGASYKVRVTVRNSDYDDFGTEVLRYDLEVMGTTLGRGTPR